MKKPETKFGEKVDLYLQAIGGIWLNVHGGPMQKAGWPDRIGCYKGKFIGIELKMAGEEPTSLQLKRINQINKSGGYATVCENITEVKNFLKKVVDITNVF